MLVLGLLGVLLILVPIAELYVIVQVASGIGVLETIALLILVSIAGAWLVKWQGLVTIARFQRQVAAGKVPTAEIVDGVLIILAGALLLTPGFLSAGQGAHPHGDRAPDQEQPARGGPGRPVDDPDRRRHRGARDPAPPARWRARALTASPRLRSAASL